mmetsp:Transcript_68916/g.125749  ORF Transcript_68916/g.125749 Transcript_68916/m.125749 type:complete len:284 (-) Transcript_68916:389-1240(-)
MAASTSDNDVLGGTLSCPLVHGLPTDGCLCGFSLGEVQFHMGNCDIICQTTCVLSHLQVDVAFFTPCRCPAVPHNPIRRGSCSVETRCHHAMILGICCHGTASLCSEDTASVVIPGPCIHTDGDWSLLQSCCQCFEILVLASTLCARWHCVRISCDSCIASAQLLELAIDLLHLRFWACHCCRRLCQALLIRDVEGVRQACDGLEVFVSTLCEATVAPKATILSRGRSAAGDLLRGESNGQLAACAHDHLGLNGFCGRECPTRSALALVFDRSHGFRVAPIDA